MTTKYQKPGPWDDEPDHLEFRHAGFDCVIHRVPHGGHLCGYVGLPIGHPLFGVSEGQPHASLSRLLNRDVSMDDIGVFSLVSAALKSETPQPTIELAIHTHQGVTYVSGSKPGSGVHRPRWESGRMVCGDISQRWWIGFDCSHYGDLRPRDQIGDGVYRDLQYVMRKVREMADQLASVGKQGAEPGADG